MQTKGRLQILVSRFLSALRGGFLALGAGMLVMSCTAVPFEPEKPVERALPVEDTRISKTVRSATLGLADDGVLLAPLTDGTDALGARLRLIEQAERSIDLKTFLIKPDIAGALIWLQLYEAAERGVKVRLLYDDVFTSASDDQIATLDAHPNVEIRTFNPLSRNSTTVMNFVLDFGRVNRRMHNKAMIVDGALAIVGGRNIADEYFQIRTKNEFADFDLLVGGGPVAELSEAFDRYWNDEWAVPLQRISEGDDTRLREARALLTTEAFSEEAEIYQNAVNSRYLNDLRSRREPLYTGEARVVVDDPEKLRQPPGKGPFIVGNSFYNTIMRAQSEVLVITPYFVPEQYGADVFADLAARGIRVRVVTNSLAATNHAYVYGGYAPYRDQLLQAGVEFLEVRKDAPALTVGSDVPLVLHSKLAVIDDDVLFVGSTNIDPRSIRQNSEIGMVIESPELSRAILQGIDQGASDYTFQVEPGPNGAPIWRYTGAADDEVYTASPGATGWQKLIAMIAGWLPIEQQL
ncbi:MAG: phospholipase D family protein [Dinoroseobacter sp.]|nr:phospholipase D family protein [Dinoroseobacter sp.]